MLVTLGTSVLPQILLHLEHFGEIPCAATFSIASTWLVVWRCIMISQNIYFKYVLVTTQLSFGMPITKIYESYEYFLTFQQLS